MFTSAALALTLLGSSVINVNAVVSHLPNFTALSSDQISEFKPYTFFAGAAYCQTNTTVTWTCGANCVANPDFLPTQVGGDGGEVQFWFVGFSPTLNSVIVGHQGTDTTKESANATDANITLRHLNSSLFPSVHSSVEVHSGFANEQEKTALDILHAVNDTLLAHQTNTVTTVGHSLGAALALLDAVYLTDQLPEATVRAITYGMPRVGNKAFADYVDAHVIFSRVTNREDIVPVLPSHDQGYYHPSGEIRIQDNEAWIQCPGQDNPNRRCIAGAVPNPDEGSVLDHFGPYDGVNILCISS